MSRSTQVNEIVTSIRASTPAGRPLIVGIDGPSGAGKSTFATAIATELVNDVVVVEGDDFYADIDWSVRGDFGAAEAYAGNYDWKRLRCEVLVPAHAGHPTLRYQRYDWDNERIGDWRELETPAVLIVEGLYTLRPELRDLIDIGIYVDADRDLRIARQHERHANYDPAIAARQNAMIASWEAAELHYIQTHDPRAAAAFHISGTGTGPA
jgi:phosphoribulokinase